jgi:ABC-type transporter Mla maintaining outer membrane lipid asymmetry permease subunit MlaE/ABC-type ATPase involved in cell division
VAGLGQIHIVVRNNSRNLRLGISCRRRLSDFALLDELSPLQNVQIALDHAGPDGLKDSRQRSAELLAELRVPTDRPTSVLSGGQRQRLAIARAVGMQTDVIFYDEPTSGLDINTAAQVADLIRETQQRYQRTSVIVTHDHESLCRVADRILLLDHHRLQLQEIPRSDWHRLSALLGTPPSAVEISGTPGTASFSLRLSAAAGEFMRLTGQSCEEVLLLPWSLLPLWNNALWGFRFTWHYLVLVSGWSACIYISVAGMIIGYVAQDFVFRYLPFRQFTEPLLTENLLHATGFSLYRFLVPILSTILIAARSGAAVAADVGSKVYGSQLDAMCTLGINPVRTLRTPVLYAFLIGTPLLSFIGYAAASMMAAMAFLLSHPDLGIAFWDGHFHHYLRNPGSVFFRGSGWLLGKLLCCGAGIAVISWNCGIAPKQSGADISRGVTRTILWSTLFVLSVHFVFSLLEFTAQQ